MKREDAAEWGSARCRSGTTVRSMSAYRRTEVYWVSTRSESSPAPKQDQLTETISGLLLVCVEKLAGLGSRVGVGRVALAGGDAPLETLAFCAFELQNQLTTEKWVVKRAKAPLKWYCRPSSNTLLQ